MAVVPLRDMVIMPGVATSLFVQRESTVRALQYAAENGEALIAVAQLDPDTEEPKSDDLYKVGTEILFSRPVMMEDGTLNILASGRGRVEITNFTQVRPFLKAESRELTEITPPRGEAQGAMRSVLNLFERLSELDENVSDEVLEQIQPVKEAGRFSDMVAAALDMPTADMQALLTERDPLQRLHRLIAYMQSELEILQAEEKVNAEVQREMTKAGRENYLRERIRIMQTELGEGDPGGAEMAELRTKLDEAGLPKEARERADRELTRLAAMPPMSPEMSVIRTYLEWIADLPWSKTSDDNLDLAHAVDVLDADHFGLPKAKDRIIEFIAVRKLAAALDQVQAQAAPESDIVTEVVAAAKDRIESGMTDAESAALKDSRLQARSPILCFIGPPGTGKTSLGRSIARALGREFIRISLGGVRDEAEIRGHRRTYVGALPGRILQGMRRAGTINPVFMLDEIDKLGQDFRGDPGSALLEVLDPEQNFSFSDNYLELPYDLSKVLFVTTANSLESIPDALLDRLEVIEFSGYTEEEKVLIARKFIIPRQIDAHGLADKQVEFAPDALRGVIRLYTWEAGVRNLEREIAALCRKIARRIAENKAFTPVITADQLSDYLGPAQFLENKIEDTDQVGVATGLAWTENGGEVLTVEATLVPGKANVSTTGQLGEVMEESVQTAFNYIRSQAKNLGILIGTINRNDIHVHLPEAAVPKDGPSAGVTIALAMISALSGRPISSKIALTGEISLRGRVLPVGGIKEKVLAAHRAGLRHVLLPDQNRKDTVDIPKDVLEQMRIDFVTDMAQILKQMLGTAAKAPAKPRKKKAKTPDATPVAVPAEPSAEPIVAASQA